MVKSDGRTLFAFLRTVLAPLLSAGNVLRASALLCAAVSLGGCNFVVLAPAGDVAIQQRNLILIATGLMLLVILPVMTMTVLFAWRYRERNATAVYKPDWDHSTKVELVVWAVPLLIIIVLGAFTWVGTHLLDPYRPLGRIDSATRVGPEQRPLEVQVVALDWKWLFILPEYGVAAVNDLAAPVDRPISFRLTSATVMNSFYIPALAGQIYAMPGMETRLHAVINRPGEYVGFSANFSGAGFSEMRFPFHGLDGAGFDAWVATARESAATLDRAAYGELRPPSTANPASFYGRTDPKLYDAVVDMCVDPGTPCMRDTMALDARTALGATFASLGGVPGDVGALCGPVGTAPRNVQKARDRFSPVVGLALPRPGAVAPVETSALPPLISDL